MVAKARRTKQGMDGRAGRRDSHPALADFLPPVARWFSKTFAAPSPAQTLAWPAIRGGENVLLLAPTGSGKTLAAFLCAIDDLFRRARGGELPDGVQVLYISPLKALGNDIHRNLLEPLEGVRKASRGRLPELRVAVRTGDTPQSERARMVRNPPHILITTPESLYLLLGSARMAPALESIRTVIVDEVHALCDNKRGVHLAVSVERFALRARGPLQRIGCSATLSPLDEIAGFLVGRDQKGRPRPCTILNAGMRRDLDVEVIAPLPDFLEAGNTALWASAYERLLDEIKRHDTTLIFCNSRYKAERTALRLGELAEGAARIGVHHGSMSKERRLEAEDELKAGGLDALVATASLELGIDIGSVNLVCQLESSKSVATGLQRIGRAGHLLDATSKGRVLIFDRDELSEAAAICKAMLSGEIDAVRLPRGCLDVLAQQIVGAVAARDWDAGELFTLFRRAYPYAELSREQFDSVLGMLAGEHPFEMARAPWGLVLWDRATDRLSGARGSARISAMCVGTIAESSEYEVVISGSKKRVGRVQSEFVDDSLRSGDVFVLGSSSWKVDGVRRNQLLVQEAPGCSPTVPWWTGPTEARTVEVGARIGGLRREVAARLDDADLPEWLAAEYRLGPQAATALIDYVREQRAGVGVVPDHQRFLAETWRDELGRTNLILHCPYGQRINRTWGLVLAAAAKRESGQRWSVTASNDVLVMTLAEQETPPHHTVDARRLLASVTSQSLPELIPDVAAGAVSGGTAFREVAVCALQILRAWQGQRVPLWLQNYRAQELYEAAGDCPEYPVILEVRRQYLESSLDLAGLAHLLAEVESGEIEMVYREVESPSPFAHSLLAHDLHQGGHQMGRDRRAQLLRLHRKVLQEVLTSDQMAELLDQRAIERLERRVLRRAESARARSSDELAQVIRDLGDLPATAEAVAEVTDGDALELLEPLVQDRRVVAVELPDCEQDPVRLVSADRWREYHDAYAHARSGRKHSVLLPRIEEGVIGGFEVAPAVEVIPAKWRRRRGREAARRAIVERYLRTHGPVSLYEIVNHTGWPAGAVQAVLDTLVEEGKIACGAYTAAKPRPQWVNKANLEEIHRLTMGYLRRELAACAPYEVVDFLTRWQHLHPTTRLQGEEGLREVVRQLQGVEVIQGVLETEVLPGRVEGYRPEMLDRMIASGEVCWRRVSTKRLQRGLLTLCLRKDMEWIANGSPREFDAEEEADEDIADVIIAVRRLFRERGPSFFDDILEETGLDEGAVRRAVWHLVWCGELTCDTYECVRHAQFSATLSACYDLDSTPRKIVSGRMSADRVLRQMNRRKLDPRLGRWSPTERLAPPRRPLSEGTVARRWAQQLLARWGIVTRDIVAAEVSAPSWSSLSREFKRLELLGAVSRGYFIESHQGEQYGLPEAIELLRDCRARRGDGRELGYLEDEPVFCITNRDPANLYGWCLDIVEERGSVFGAGQRRGNFTIRMVIQAGQVLLYRERQLVTLTRRQLARCIEELKRDAAGEETSVRFRQWNGYPIQASPVAGVLSEAGFQLLRDGTMRWPPRGRGAEPAPISKQEEFLPYYSEPPRVEYGVAWLMDRASAALRPVLKEVLGALAGELERRGWDTQWHDHGAIARYRDWAAVYLYVRKSVIYINIATKSHREGDKRVRFRKYLKATVADGVDEGVIATLRAHLQTATEIADRRLDRGAD